MAPSRQKLKYLFELLGVVFVLITIWYILIHHLNLSSMWGDEHYTWRISREGPFYLVPETGLDVHPPAHYIWVWLWRSWLGGSDNLLVLRLSSAITSLLTVAVTFRLGAEWFRSRWVGLGAALFIGTSGVFVFYARDLRMYSLITLLAALSWLMLKRLFDRKRGSVWAYAAAIALMAYTFYSAVFIVMVQFVVMLVFYRQHWRRLLLAFGIAFVAFLPWLPTFLHQIDVTRAQRGAEDALIVGPLATTPTSLAAIEEFVNVYTAYQPAFVLLLIALALAIGLNMRHPAHYRRRLMIAGLWFGLTITLVLVVNLVVPVYGLRYVITILPGLALLVGASVFHLRRFWARAATVSIIFLVGVLSHDSVFDTILVRAPHRELLQTIAADFQPGDKIWYNLTDGARGSTLELASEYHLTYDTPTLSPDDFVWDAPRDYDDSEQVPRVWDVRPYWMPMPEDARQALETDRFITEEHEIQGYTVRLYEAPPPDQPVYTFGDTLEMMPGSDADGLYAPGATVAVRTWWRAAVSPSLNYSFGLYLQDSAGAILAQADERLERDDRPTSQWPVNDAWEPITLTLELPNDLAAGSYELMLGIYFWQDPERLPVAGEAQQRIDTRLALLRVAEIQVR